jgi:hypothetical protein
VERGTPTPGTCPRDHLADPPAYVLDKALAIAALASSIYVAVPAVVIASLGNGAAVVCNALFIQRGAPDELRGRAFTVIMSSTYATLGAGMILKSEGTGTVSNKISVALGQSASE